MPKDKPSPYQRICRAAERGLGVRLSAHECAILADDHAIYLRAGFDDDNDRGIPDPQLCEHGDLKPGCPVCALSHASEEEEDPTPSQAQG